MSLGSAPEDAIDFWYLEYIDKNTGEYLLITSDKEEEQSLVCTFFISE